MTTPWTEFVGPGNAHPEYPRPQLTRRRWKSLNGVWQYARADRDAPPLGRNLAERILVPYPTESALSGIGRHDDTMWYRRMFTVPRSWHEDRILLHFGAVDQQATVWVNGARVATHDGGYASFTADVTDALRTSGRQEVVVHATDRDEDGGFPLGKQRFRPGGILYTGSSGIWQTVWLEPVPRTHVERLDITTDVAGRAATVHVYCAATATAEVAVSEPGGRVVARRSGGTGTPIRLPVDSPRLWSPSDPYLYDVSVRLLDDRGHPIDAVRSYLGMRSVELVTDARGHRRIALNGKVLFQLGSLDQGYWPDGCYTAPTDEALRFDLEQTKALGFNMVRKHMKVEPQRWYYWADRLGLLVWQDMPALPIDLSKAPGTQSPPPPAEHATFTQGLRELIEQHRNAPSIVMWVPFNEGWGEFDTAAVARETARLDPERLVNAASGVNCCYSLPDSYAGDVYDDHTYVGPGTPGPAGDRAVVDGEYGGLGLAVDGHLWPVGTPEAYELVERGQDLTQRYGQLADALARAACFNGVSAAVYTQTTDVENEVNGLLTYDRRIVKPDVATVRDHNLSVIAAGSPGLGTARSATI